MTNYEDGKKRIDELAQQNLDYLSGKTAMAYPEVGLFWVYQGNVYGNSVPINDVLPDPGTRHKDDKRLHVYEWFKVKPLMQGLPSDAKYTDVPRGRVVYFEEDRQFQIWANAETLGDSGIVSKILEFYRIPTGANVELVADPHYDMGKKE